ncbi:MAG: aminopeptidase P family protein [Mangrovibacterium sp.]
MGTRQEKSRQIRQRLAQVRSKMRAQQIDAWYVSGTDPHQSEYLPDHWQSRAFLTGFTGSAGSVVVTESDAALWTDSRYFLQAADQLKGTGIKLMKMRMPGTPRPAAWLGEKLSPNSIVATEASCMAAAEFRSLGKELKNIGMRLQHRTDLLVSLWTNRPALPVKQVFEHEMTYAGTSRQEKIRLIRDRLVENGTRATLLTALDDIAWTFNLRGHDVRYNPVFVAYALITDSQVSLYMPAEKLPSTLKTKLKAEKIGLRPYEAVFSDLKKLDVSILLDPACTNQGLYEAIPKEAIIRERTSIPSLLKAVKSDAELQQIRETMKKDGAAMVRFLHWIYKTVGTKALTDYDIALKLDEFRTEQQNYQGPSFSPIVGYQETGAVVHRSVSKADALPVNRKGILLIDSGGQYLSGTTDITRTIALSVPSARQKTDFTLALKGMISLTNACFPENTPGCNLDILARKAMWEHGITYGHGTCHGIGFFLNVHEGPMSIRQEYNANSILPGMVLSNEPGIYREGEYGIRTENMMVCVERKKTDFGNFLGFETLTLCPIDRTMIDTTLLTAEEKKWTDRYHVRCYQELAPLLNMEEKIFLKQLTAPLK